MHAKEKEKKKDLFKEEAYYVEKIEKICARTKGVYLVARGGDKEEGTYHIWSSRLDDDEMRNPTHGAMCVKLEEDEKEEVASNVTSEEEEITG